MRTIFVVIIFTFVQQSYAKAIPIPQYEMMKVWNFLKYYHPDLASGKVNADSLFLENIEHKKLNINNSIYLLTNNLNNSFSPKKTNKKPSDIIDLNQNFEWYHKNAAITRKNKRLLNQIYHNRFLDGPHFYIPKDGFTTNIPNEKEYNFSKEENLPLRFRLLALAKIIGAIDYLYPHKYLMSEDSNQILEMLVKECINSDSRKAFEIILAKAVALMEDSHSFKFYNQFNYKKEIYHTQFFAPFDFQIVQDYILVTHIIIPEMCEKANITVGDKIKFINNKSIQQIINEKKIILSSSNMEGLHHRLSDYQNNLIWTDDELFKNLVIQKRNNSENIETKIELVNPTEKSDINLILEYLKSKIQHKNLKSLIHNDIAYFRVDQTFQFIENLADEQIDSEMEKIFNKAISNKAIVFDMRGYPDWGGFIYTYIYNFFSPRNNYFGKYYQQNLNNIGTFVYVENPETYFPHTKTLKARNYLGKVFIIVNEETLSASEWNTMNLQSIFPQSITIGQKTAGADGDIKRLTLPGGYILEFTGNGIFYPNGNQTQKTGIRIDKIIEYSDQDFLNQHDKNFEFIQSAL